MKRCLFLHLHTYVDKPDGMDNNYDMHMHNWTIVYMSGKNVFVFQHRLRCLQRVGIAHFLYARLSNYRVCEDMTDQSWISNARIKGCGADALRKPFYAGFLSVSTLQLQHNSKRCVRVMQID